MQINIHIPINQFLWLMESVQFLRFLVNSIIVKSKIVVSMFVWTSNTQKHQTFSKKISFNPTSIVQLDGSSFVLIQFSTMCMHQVFFQNHYQNFLNVKTNMSHLLEDNFFLQLLLMFGKLRKKPKQTTSRPFKFSKSCFT